MNDVFAADSLLYIVPIFIGTYWLSRRSLYGPLDPMMIAFLSLSASLGTMIYYLLDLKIFSESIVLVQFFVLHIVLITAFNIGYKSRTRQCPKSAEPTRGKLLLINNISIGLLVIYFIYVHLVAGVGFLELDHEVQKLRIFSEGGGLLRRAIYPWSLFCFFNVHYLYSRGHLSRLTVTILAALLGTITWASGGKASLINLFVIFFYSHVFLTENRIAKRKIGLHWAVILSVLLIFGQLSYMFSRFSREADRAVDENIDLASSWNLIAKRMVASGDFSLYYVTTGGLYALNKDWRDFLKSMNGCLLGPLRLAPYERALGAEMIETALQASNEKDTGPNAMAPFVAMIYFGPLVGTLGIAAVGLLLGYLRKSLWKSVSRDYYGAALFVMSNSLLYIILIDYTLFFMYFHTTVAIFAILALLRIFEKHGS